MRKKTEELVSIKPFLQEKVETGELEQRYVEDVERSWIEMYKAMQEGDHHMVMVAVNDIARKFVR